ncbi:MAG: hypothetical protein JW870_07795 [Candidatus Delongbacteria bacterium]|nr:hypothetical protein [Candidatus Delongbacteria bacterium]
MGYNKIGIWIKGYMDALKNEDDVSKKQLEYLISRIQKMIAECEKQEKIEQETFRNIVEDIDDELPF